MNKWTLIKPQVNPGEQMSYLLLFHTSDDYFPVKNFFQFFFRFKDLSTGDLPNVIGSQCTCREVLKTKELFFKKNYPRAERLCGYLRCFLIAPFSLNVFERPQQLSCGYTEGLASCKNLMLCIKTTYQTYSCVHWC